jgi:hypothetical protein
MFYIFLRACKKYRFDYTLHALNGFIVTLRPKDNFGFVEVKQEYYDKSYFKLFVKAIKKMKEYRKENGYR